MALTAKAVSQDQTPALPEWIRVLPRGTVELSDHREPFLVDEASLMSMVAEVRSRGVDLVIDYEHPSLQGERAPAAGQIQGGVPHPESRAVFKPGGQGPGGEYGLSKGEGEDGGTAQTPDGFETR